MSSTRTSDVKSLRRQVAQLQQRLSSIERALKPAGAASRAAVVPAQPDRDEAQWRARHEAMREYWKQREIDQYRQSPELLKMARDRERNINAFLRDRGIKPAKSDLAKIAKLLAEEPKTKGAETARAKSSKAAQSASKGAR